jgi:hypothetical protein
MTIPQAIAIARATTSTLWTMMKKDVTYFDHSPDRLREVAAEVLADEVERLWIEIHMKESRMNRAESALRRVAEAMKGVAVCSK